VNAAAEVIYELVDPNANLIFGAVVDESLHDQVSLLSGILFLTLFCKSFFHLLALKLKIKLCPLSMAVFPLQFTSCVESKLLNSFQYFCVIT
jgi:hypothetical protein